MTVEESYARCHALARAHYENFPVARLVPRALRPHVSAVYAFARTADDLADEGWGEGTAPGPEQRVSALEDFAVELEAAASGKALAPEYEWIFRALQQTIQQYQLPLSLFRDLLSAFQQDCRTLRYARFEDVLDYCRRSANPIGRLVLHLHGHRQEAYLQWSDTICTGLQLANFWQDVGVDIRKDGRIYIPEEDWPRFGVEAAMFTAPAACQALRDCLQFQVGRTREFFEAGRPLGKKLPWPLGLEIRLTWQGGITILQKIAAQNYDTLAQRPKLQRRDLPGLLARALFG